MKLSGGCHCGAVRYLVMDTPFHETVCHCIDCRRVSGAPSVAWFSVHRAKVTWTGDPAFYRSSRRVTRRFCDRCGTTLTFEDDSLPEELDLATASLDDPEHVPPKDHVWTQQKVVWDNPGDGLPRFGRRRTG